jgi:hypothetical protein
LTFSKRIDAVVIDWAMMADTPTSLHSISNHPRNSKRDGPAVTMSRRTTQSQQNPEYKRSRSKPKEDQATTEDVMVIET